MQADYIHNAITERIREFEEAIGEDRDVAIQFAAYDAAPMYATRVTFTNPDTIIFYGYIGGEPAAVVQNAAQLNFRLLAVRRREPEKPKVRIGFGAD